jgi:hypothetical protein
VLDETKATNGEVAPGQYMAWNHNANLQIVEDSQVWDSNLRTDKDKRVGTKRRKRDAENKAINKRHSETQQELRKHSETLEDMKRRHGDTQEELQEVKTMLMKIMSKP